MCTKNPITTTGYLPFQNPLKKYGNGMGSCLWERGPTIGGSLIYHISLIPAHATRTD